MEALLSVQPRVFPADEPVPRKLYLPMVSVVAALSNKNESLDFELYTLQHQLLSSPNGSLTWRIL